MTALHVGKSAIDALRRGADWLLPPALLRLLCYQAGARWRRLGRGFTARRRWAISGLAVVVGAVWLGNTLLAVLLREPANPANLEAFLASGLLAYAVWHLVKTAYRRPEEAVEWSPAEQAWVCGGPFERRHLLAYRFGGIVLAAMVKAALFVLLLLPDLPAPAVAYAGVVAALLFLELWRMAWEIAAWGMSRRVYLGYRAVVLAGAAALLAAGLGSFLARPIDWQAALTPGNLSLLGHAGDCLVELANTPLGDVVLAPFAVFAKAILARGGGWMPAGWLSLAVVMVSGLAAITIDVEPRLQRLHRQRERKRYCPQSRSERELAQETPAAPKLARIPWLGGAGPLAWRQAMGLWHYGGQVAAALVVPGLLACLPLVVAPEPQTALVHMVGSLIFYTCLLLPPALRFDFRRDLDRLVILKTLPIRPLAVVVGQLATPVAAATAFQVAVITVGTFWRSLPLASAATAAVLLAVVNMILFALENVLYLLYPYRLQEESVRIILRATLVFTAKGLLMAGAFAVAFGWSLAAQWIASTSLIQGLPGGERIVFVGGLGLILGLAATLATILLLGAYQRFDPSQDVPA